MPTRKPSSCELPHGFLLWLVFWCFINGTWVTTSHPETYMLWWSGPPQACYGLLLLLHRNLTGTLPHLKRMRVELLNLGGFELLEVPHNKGVTGPSSAIAAWTGCEEMTDTGLILGEPSSYLLFAIFFSLLTASFFLFALPTGGFYLRVLPS